MPDQNEKILLESTKGAGAGGRLAGILASNPRLRSMIEGLSPEDTRRLGSVLSDSEQLGKILSSPQARKIMDSIKKKGGMD